MLLRPINWVNTPGYIPSIAFAKDETYKYQSEVRLCIGVAVDVVTPLIVNGNNFWNYCRIMRRHLNAYNSALEALT